MIEATAAKVGSDSVFSHVSAAVLHGLPLWNVDLRRVHTTRPTPTGGYSSRRLHVHPGPVPSDHVVVVDGLATSSVAWTVVSLARTLPFEEAVVVGDAALHLGLVDHRAIEQVLAALEGRPGMRSAAASAAFINGKSESVGESRSRVRIFRARLPEPVLQQALCDGDGDFIGRVDFYFRDHRTVGEFDGQVKYGRNAGDTVFAEKVREDTLRSAGFNVVRWTWRDLDQFDRTAARIRRAFAQRAD